MANLPFADQRHALGGHPVARTIECFRCNARIDHRRLDIERQDNADPSTEFACKQRVFTGVGAEVGRLPGNFPLHGEIQKADMGEQAVLFGKKIPQLHLPSGHFSETIEMQAASQKGPAAMEKACCKILLPALETVGDNQHAAKFEPFFIPGKDPPGEAFLRKQRLP